MERTGKAAELFEKAGKLSDKADYSGAVAMFSEVINLLPNDFEAIYRRGSSYQNDGNLEKAAADIDKAFELGQEGADFVYWRLGNDFEEIGNKNKAIEYYRKSVEGGDWNHGSSQKALARLGATSGNMNTGNVEFR